MRRTSVFLLVVGVLLGTILGGGMFATAQDAELADHPLIGSWVLDVDVDDPDNLPELVTISSDGTALLTTSAGRTGHGSWAATSDTTATLTFLFVSENGTRWLLRFDAEEVGDGQSFVAPYTIELFNASDESSGELGPRTAEGTRIGVADPSTPVASFDEFPIGEFLREAEDAPEATPGA